MLLPVFAYRFLDNGVQRVTQMKKDNVDFFD